jgi:hypothetical protein
MRSPLAQVTCNIHGKMRSTYILVGKPKGEKSLREHRRGYVNNIEIDFTELGFYDIIWIHLPQVRGR